ncbi:prepilin peptidase [Rugamonas sp.]|uniref:A24 family peptidase n=1 Tax=Rugamonas sp. TaxID=1926287 RepID=UPI0025FFCECF|nr:prepilin peptidase [Rugamonas sp.]
MRPPAITDLPLLVLCCLLAAAVLTDVRSRRIPNKLVLTGAAAGLALQTALAPGDGLFTAPFGGIGIALALAGLGLGLALLLPMYALRAMGAGDVKLLAMIGVFVGPRAVTGIWVCTLVAGGVLALLVSLRNGTLKRMVNNSYHLMLHGVLGVVAGNAARIDAPANPSGKLPYAIALAAGTLPYLVYARVTGASLFE